MSDMRCEMIRAMGLELDLVQKLGTVRSKRWSMVVVDGKVTELNVEPDGFGLSCSVAEKIQV